MASLRLANVSFAYPHQTRLLDDLTLDFEPGWTGVVGPNGAGKTTLLRLLNGELEPSSGRVQVGDLRVVTCTQRLARTEAVDAFANAWTRESLRWISLLELEPERYAAGGLSPGLERRWQIAAALYDEPGLLILDEPTNHIDQEGRSVLVRALQTFRGVGVICSHDRGLLDELTVRTVRVHGGGATLYPAPYSRARELWLAEERGVLEALEAKQAVVRRMAASAAATASRHASATHGLSTRSRMTSVRDHDARSMGTKLKAEWAEARIARDRGVASRALERARSELAELARPAATPSQIRLDGGAARREWVTQFEFEELCGGPVRVLGRSRVAVRRDDRLWLRGPNGCGKTTLLRRIIDEVARSGLEFLEIPQNLETMVGATRAVCAALTPEERTRTIELGAALGLAPDAVLEERALSPGEHRKLVLALGLRSAPRLVLLDEPTNDLDLESVERLELALQSYDGALIVSTHDQYFAEAAGLEAWDLPWDSE